MQFLTDKSCLITPLYALNLEYAMVNMLVFKEYKTILS